MNTNKTIAEQYRKNLESLGLKISLVKEKGMGSVDIGNVSHKIPAIHAYMSVTDKIMPGHSREFAQAVVSKLGRERLIMSAKVLALTGLDLLVDKSLILKAKKELHNWQKEQEK
jgi:metal-dependent amidase/aminoacylase/carboxypeptidase family protein